MISVTIQGAEGRMGRLVTSLVEEAPDCELVALITEPGREQPVGKFHPRLPLTSQNDLAQVNPPGGVIVDFSLASSLPGLLAGGESTGAPLVIGTTGYTASQQEDLKSYSQQQPVVLAANFSIGIPTLEMLLEKLASTLPDSFTAEEVEVHHRHKVDRPSGTANTLAQAWQNSRGGPEVPVHSLRLGGIIGEHTWTISDDEETLILSHRAHSRQAFLRGVLPAVRFVTQQNQGMFNVRDVLIAAGRISDNA